MNKLNLNTDAINKIAAAEFHRHTGRTLTEKPNWIWTERAVELIEHYNRVVEILELNAGCKCGDQIKRK